MQAAQTPSLIPPVFAVVLDPEGQPEDSVQVQIDPDRLLDPETMGQVLFVLQMGLAQSLTQAGKALDPQDAFVRLQDGFIKEFNTAFGPQQTPN